MVNLDYLAAKHGQPLAFEDEVEEPMLNDALSILHEQGIYALFLWLYADRDKRKKIGERIQAFFRDADSPISLAAEDDHAIWQTDANRGLNNVRDTLTSNLKTMFFAKELISLMLIYARHAAKAATPEPPPTTAGTTETVPPT